jgi:hypothetical protein
MKRVLPILLASLCVGWIAGLSVSPVVGEIISALLAVLLAIVASIAGPLTVQTKSRNPERQPRQLLISPNPWPISLVAIGLAVGASAGLYARSHDWFLRDLKATADRLVAAGADQRTAAQALVAHYYAAPQPASAESEKAAPQAASGAGFGLYAEKTDFCEVVRGNQLAPIKDMRKILNRSDSAAVQEVSQMASDGEVVILMRIICPR